MGKCINFNLATPIKKTSRIELWQSHSFIDSPSASILKEGMVTLEIKQQSHCMKATNGVGSAGMFTKHFLQSHSLNVFQNHYCSKTHFFDAIVGFS